MPSGSATSPVTIVERPPYRSSRMSSRRPRHSRERRLGIFNGSQRDGRRGRGARAGVVPDLPHPRSFERLRRPACAAIVHHIAADAADAADAAGCPFRPTLSLLRTRRGPGRCAAAAPFSPTDSWRRCGSPTLVLPLSADDLPLAAYAVLNGRILQGRSVGATNAVVAELSPRRYACSASVPKRAARRAAEVLVRVATELEDLPLSGTLAVEAARSNTPKPASTFVGPS